MDRRSVSIRPSRHNNDTKQPFAFSLFLQMILLFEQQLDLFVQSSAKKKKKILRRCATPNSTNLIPLRALYFDRSRLFCFLDFFSVFFQRKRAYRIAGLNLYGNSTMMLFFGCIIYPLKHKLAQYCKCL